MMQQLVAVERLFPAILNGTKTSTIRWNEPRIESGPMTYLCEGNSSRTASVWVTKCTDLPLSQVAAFLGKEAEWPDATMLAGMREHYPKINLTDIVQVIEHLTPAESLSRLSRG
jgi:hypothetical protein